MATTLYDPAIFEWLLALRSHDMDDEADAGQHLREFRRMAECVREILSRGHGQVPDLQWVADRQTLDRRTSLRIARLGSVGEPASGSPTWDLEVRTLLDCYYLQVARIWEGCYETDRFPAEGRDGLCELRFSDRAPHSFVGDAVALWFETEDDDLYAVSRDAHVVACRWSTDDLPFSPCIQVPWGALSLYPLEQHDLFTLAVQRSEEAVSEATTFVHRTLPDIVLSRCKARLLRQRYDTALHPETLAAERVLSGALSNAPPGETDCDELERRAVRIAVSLASLGEAIGRAEADLAALRIAWRNVLSDLSELDAGHSLPRLTRSLASDLEFDIEQREADLRFFRITQERAVAALEAIQTLADVENSRFGRRSSSILGVIALILGVAGSLGELPIWARLGIMGAGSAVWVLFHELWLPALRRKLRRM